MQTTTPGQHKTFEAFRAHLRSIHKGFDADAEVLGENGPLGASLDYEGATIGNRFCVHPMEGWDGTHEGLPSELTRRRWRNFGKSGAKLIWGGEAFAVQADGRANPNQLFLNPGVDVQAGVRTLLDELHAGHREIGADPSELFTGLQLTHSGRFARPGSEPEPRLACHNPALDAKFGIDSDAKLLTDTELEGIAANYVRAAKLADDAGFDFVDVKCCHGYLMHDLLGAKSRPGPYGGSFENRTRLFQHIVDEIRSTCPALDIGVRVSIADLFPYSPEEGTRVGTPAGIEDHVPYEHGFGVDANDPSCFDLTEPFAFLSLLSELSIRLVNITAGSPYYCPHLQRPATYPPSDGYLPPEDPLASVVRHLELVRMCKAAFPHLILVGTGYSYLQEWLPNVAQHEIRNGHVDFVGLGRMVLSYPELPRDVLAGRPLQRKKICRTFSDCTTAPRKGMVSGCYPLDPHYKALPEAERLKALKKEMR